MAAATASRMVPASVCFAACSIRSRIFTISLLTGKAVCCSFRQYVQLSIIQPQRASASASGGRIQSGLVTVITALELVLELELELELELVLVLVLVTIATLDLLA